MTLEIRLLGTPVIMRDGVPVHLAGRKPWALLAMLVLDPAATNRADLIARLTPEADDPQAALRWLLHQARRALDPGGRISEERSNLRLELDDDSFVDVSRVLSLDPELAGIETLGRGELLEGMDFRDAPAVDLWLTMERARVRGAASEVLWWAATRIADAEPQRAMQIVRRGLDLDPYCETKHELVIDLYLRDGDLLGARQHAEAVERLYREDLGIEAPDWIRRPLDRLRHAAASPGPGPTAQATATARALIRAADARLMSGDAAKGLETARRALVAVPIAADPGLEIAALLVLARAITHTGRAPASEAKGLFTRAATLAVATHDDAAVADAQRGMGFACLVEGDYGAGTAAFDRSTAVAARLGDERRAAQAMTYRGLAATDRCEHRAARDLLEEAFGRFLRLPDDAWSGYAEGMLARSLDRAGDHAGARRHARESRARLEAAGWIAVLPVPMLAEADAILALGDPAMAEGVLADVLALAQENGDPIAEGLALWGLGRVRRTTGDRPGAIDHLQRAIAAIRAFGDGHAWASAAILTDLVEFEAGRDPDHLEEATRIAVAGPLPDLAERLRRSRGQRRTQTPLQTASA